MGPTPHFGRKISADGRRWHATPVYERLEQLVELFGGQAGYSQDRAKRARGEIAVAMDRSGDYARDAGLPEVVVTATHIR